MTCANCRNNFTLPMHKPNEIKWAYRGIGPFSKNNKVGGIMAVFLTLNLFSREFADISGNLSALFGFELLKKENVKEVDLTVMLHQKHKDSIPPDLVFCECKTFKNFTSKLKANGLETPPKTEFLSLAGSSYDFFNNNI